MKSPLQNPKGIITNANNVCLIAVDYSHEFKQQCKSLKFAPLISLDWSQLLSIFMVVEFASNQTYRVCVPVQVMSDVLLEEDICVPTSKWQVCFLLILHLRLSSLSVKRRLECYHMSSCKFRRYLLELCAALLLNQLFVV